MVVLFLFIEAETRLDTDKTKIVSSFQPNNSSFFCRIVLELKLCIHSDNDQLKWHRMKGFVDRVRLERVECTHNYSDCSVGQPAKIK